jgi:hypothetical protein
VVLWPKSGPVETSPGHAFFWVPKGYWGSSSNGSEPNKGIVLCAVSIDSSGQGNVTRLADVPIFPSSQPAYGNMAATRDDSYVYLYASHSGPTFLARVPLGSAANKTQVSFVSGRMRLLTEWLWPFPYRVVLSSDQYQYYDNHTKSWSSIVPSLSDTAQALFTTTFGVDGNVFYSSYHQAWLMIYNYRADNKVYLRTAFAPEGPWVNNTMIYQPPRPTNPNVSYIYATTGTNLYDSSGLSAIVDFTWTTATAGYANWVTKITFKAS